jgi:prepilin-type N-terminal cleavage/methylation domain-containing protein
MLKRHFASDRQTFHLGATQTEGFSLLELAVVVAILSILAGISIPAFVNILKSSRIDEAKSKLNSAIAECLQKYRSDPINAATAVVPESSLAGLEQAGYKIDASKNKCNDFMISPADPKENYLFPMGFMVRNGKVTKLATPASDRGSESACKSWGTCGIPPELQAEWDRLAKIEADKKVCNDAFYTFLNSGSKGQKNVWDDTNQSCSRVQWVLDGTRYTSKDAYDAAFTAKVGKECAASLATYARNNPPNGLYRNEACDINTYFLNGTNLESSDPAVYQAKQKEYNDLQCNAAEQVWLSAGSAGAFTWPAGLSCNAKWKCPAENNKIYLDLNSYKTSSCAAPPPAPTPPADNCTFRLSSGVCLY